MSVKLLTEHYLEFLSLKEGCTGSSESTLVKMSNCWKSHAVVNSNPSTTKYFHIFISQPPVYVMSETWPTPVYNDNWP